MLTFDGMRLVQGDFTLSADFAIPTQGVTAVIGPSGGGKSTLLAAVAGFFAPVAGRVLWQGQDMTGQQPGVRPVAMLFQDNNLFPHLTAAQNVGLGLRPVLRLRDSERALVDGALERVGLAGFGGRKPGALSGGQQSRVALARVLVAARPLVLLDEPFAALGPALKADMLQLVKEVLVADGRTVVMVTHDPRDAQALADRVVLVADGCAAAPVRTAEIFANPPAALTAYLGG